MHHFPLRKAAVVLGAALALAGCGFLEDDSDDQGSEVPSSAQQSVSGLIDYLRSLIAASSETAEPVSLGNAVLPTDETSEPAAVN